MVNHHQKKGAVYRVQVFEVNYFYLRLIVQVVILAFDELFLFNPTTMDNQHVAWKKNTSGSFYYK